MIETLRHFIEQFGYFAVAIGCFFEGETSVLLGIFAAHREMLAVEGVFIATIVGTMIGDNLWFHVGRHMGRAALNRRPDWQAKATRVEHLLERYGPPVMIGFRFLYGLRYVTPFVLGSIGVSPLRFFCYATIGTLIWASTITFIGVYLANAVQAALEHIHDIEQGVLIFALLASLSAAGYYWLRRRRFQR